MIAATANESNGKSSQATFLKVGQNLYRNESSETYYGLTKRAGKQFRTALRMTAGTPPDARVGGQNNSIVNAHGSVATKWSAA